MKLKVIAFSLLAVMASPQVLAKDFLLGRTILLEAKNNHAKIPVPACRHAKEIRIQAEKDTFVSKVVFKFQNGDERTVQFQRKFDRNERSDWRKFAYSRCVSDIQVHGRAENGSAGIKVFGRN